MSRLALLWFARRRAFQESAWSLDSQEELDGASADAVPLASPDVEMAEAISDQRGSQTGGSLLSSEAAAREVASADVEMAEEAKEEEPMTDANTIDTRNESIHEAVIVDDSMEVCSEHNRVSTTAKAGHLPLENSVESSSLNGNETSGESMMALLLGPVPEAPAASDVDAESPSLIDAHVNSSGAKEGSRLRSGKRWRMGISQLDCNVQSRTMNTVQDAATHEDAEETETENEYKDMEDSVCEEEGREEDTEENEEEDTSRRPSNRRRTASGKLCCYHLDCPKQAILRGLCMDGSKFD